MVFFINFKLCEFISKLPNHKIIKLIFTFFIIETFCACHIFKPKHYKAKYSPKKYIIYTAPKTNRMEGEFVKSVSLNP